MPSSSSRAPYRIQSLIVVAFCASVATALVGAEPHSDWTSLSRQSSFTAWRADHHGWKIVGDVSLNPHSVKQLYEKRGRGVLVSKGDASNLESREDYQD